MSSTGPDDEVAEAAESVLQRAKEDPSTLEPGDLEPVFAAAGGRAIQFVARTVLERDLDAAAAAATVSAVRPVLDAPESPRRAYALAFLADLALDQPAAVADASPAIAARLDDDATEVHEEAIRALANVAESEPTAVLEHLDAVRPFLDATVADIRMDAAAFVSSVAAVRPGAVAETVPTLLAVVGERYQGLGDVGEDAGPGRSREMEHIREQDWEMKRTHDRARREAAEAVFHVAAGRPDAVAREQATLLQILGQPDPDDAIRWILEATGAAADVDTGLGEAAISPLADHLSAERDLEIAAAAAWALGIISEAHQERVARAVTPHLPALISHLEAGGPAERARITGLLMYVAESAPRATAQMTPALLGCLDTDSEVVQWGAVTALGYAGTRRAREPLAELAESATSEDVRSAAAAAVDRLDRRHGTA